MARIGYIRHHRGAFSRGARPAMETTAARSGGFKYILSQAAARHTVEATTIARSVECDYLFFSVTNGPPLLDTIALIRRIPRPRPKIVLGGPGVVNIRPYKHLIDVAVFGKCEDLILGILDGAEFPNVWRRENDPHFERGYEFGQSRGTIPGEPPQGCPRKCAFCQFAWVNENQHTGGAHFDSGAYWEDYFPALDWEKARGRALSAIDALTEDGRRRVGKALSHAALIGKLREAYEVPDVGRRLHLRLFNIVGYPWEDPTGDLFAEFKDALDAADSRAGERRIAIKVASNHFMPKLFTPMETAPFMVHDFKAAERRNPVPYHTGDFEVGPDIGAQGCLPAFVETILERSTEADWPRLEKTIFSTKFVNSPARNARKLKILGEIFADKIEMRESPVAGRLRGPHDHTLPETIERWKCPRRP